MDITVNTCHYKRRYEIVFDIRLTFCRLCLCVAGAVWSVYRAFYHVAMSFIVVLFIDHVYIVFEEGDPAVGIADLSNSTRLFLAAGMYSCSVLQFVAVCCRVLQCAVQCCNVLWCEGISAVGIADFLNSTRPLLATDI